jgi:hypothetical protein
MSFDSIGKLLLLFAVILAVIGGLFLLMGRVPWLGKIPGDIHLEGRGWSCTFPLVTSIVVSILLTIVLNVILRLLNR